MKVLLKRSTILAAIVGVFTLTSCDEGLTLTIDNQETMANFVIYPATANGSNPVTMILDTITPEFQRALDSIDGTIDTSDVEEIKLNFIDVMIDSSKNNLVSNFDAVQSVSSNFGSSDLTLTTQEVANLVTVPSGTDSLRLGVTQVNLKRYFQADKIYFQMSSVLNSDVNDTVYVRARLNYAIAVKNSTE